MSVPLTTTKQSSHRMLPIRVVRLCPQQGNRVIRGIVFQDEWQRTLAKPKFHILSAAFASVLRFDGTVVVLINDFPELLCIRFRELYGRWQHKRIGKVQILKPVSLLLQALGSIANWQILSYISSRDVMVDMNGPRRRHVGSSNSIGGEIPPEPFKFAKQQKVPKVFSVVAGVLLSHYVLQTIATMT